MCALCVAGLGVVRTASADLLVFTDSIPLTATDWSEELSFPRFDPALGTLERVELTLGVTLEGTIRFESMDAAATSIETELSAEVELLWPDGSELLDVSPEHERVDAVTAFDGVVDFGGASGRTLSIIEFDSDSTDIGEPGDLAMFIGSGMLRVPIVAEAESGAGGAGSLLAMITSSASAEATLTYQYAPVPAPSAALLGTLGMGFVGWIRRRWS